MNTFRLSNIPLNDFRRFLTYHGCRKIRERGGHEIWAKDGLLRPITLQSHIDPVPERNVRTNLHTLSLSRRDLEQFLLKHK